MKYWEGISLKAIAVGFVGGYCVPYGILQGLAYALAALDITQLFGAISLFIVILVTVVAPLVSGYLGAKYSISQPIINGMSATAVGIGAFFLVGQIGAAFMYPVIVTTALIFGYVGARRYVAYG